LDSITDEEKELLDKLVQDDIFFSGFLSRKEKVTFWIYKIMKKIRSK